jgi:hypothetical protein
VPPTVEVRRFHDWAILPTKNHVDRVGPREDARLAEAHFRFHRQFRYAEACPPWVLGQQWGWQIASPVAITIGPLDDVQVALGDEAELQEAGRLLGRADFWRRGDGYLATGRNNWVRAYQYRGSSGGWEGMFLPNGQGTVEWRLGWAMRIPEDTFALVTGLDDDAGFTIPTGMLTARQANRGWEDTGFSIALRPDRPVTLTRGQPIARVALLTRDCLQAVMEELTAGHTS